MPQPCFSGIDVGASAVKVVVIDDSGDILGLNVRRSGHDFEASAKASFDAALAAANLDSGDIVRIVSTGYGRRNTLFSDYTRTEIGCHARGCFHYFPRAITVVDIGGQDNKVIKLDDRGRRINFKMNRKCAAGTGAFLEEMANRLSVPLDGLDSLARSAGGEATLGSYCTVFSATEVLEKIRAGTPLADLVKGIFRSVVKRVMEMEPLTGTVVATGGVVAHNPGMVAILEEEIGRPVLVPPHPQCTGALGAALFARDSEE
ncbi:MAG: ATPase [Deltaproteobacteria bacterium]|nr:ATPase [Deltaproteobacteria bacterium]